MSAETAPTSKRSDAGFWSNAATFFLPVGSHIDADGVRGYPIDLRIKAEAPVKRPPKFAGPGHLHVGMSQFGLGCYERWLAGEGSQWLEVAIDSGRYLMEIQAPNGSWEHDSPFPHTFTLRPPWTSGITQGQGASLLVRLYRETGEQAFAEAARRALAPLFIPQAEGGVRGELGGRPWPEEYPTTPQSHVLNGAIFALWGMRDVGLALGDAEAATGYERGLDSLAANLQRYDTGSWSLYSLYPHPVRNRASSFYHDLVINQLSAMQLVSPRPEFEATRQRWSAYAASRYRRTKAFAYKAAFRLMVPRNRYFARAAPWTRA
jgi:heparosan-N-sulfate-glucuronate 5-epimerase